MCTILISYDTTPGYRLIIAANRDEFLARPTAHLSFWSGDGILAGKDLRGGGTWLGVTRNGRFAALTNYRERTAGAENDHSRGEIVHRFLTGEQDCRRFLDHLVSDARLYRGFNLLLGDNHGLYYYCNRREEPRQLGAGIYGLSNHLLDTSWPKVLRGKKLFREVLAKNTFDDEDFFAVLGDTHRPADGDLPSTGVGKDWERLLSSIFIQSETYGTRSSAILTIDEDGYLRFCERTYHHDRAMATSNIEESFMLE